MTWIPYYQFLLLPVRAMSAHLRVERLKRIKRNMAMSPSKGLWSE